MTNDRFRDSIEFHFGDRNDIKNKQFLAQLMRKRRFFNAEDSRKRASQAQRLTTSAWIYLKYKREEIVYIKPKGFKKSQIREIKTGRILGWE